MKKITLTSKVSKKIGKALFCLGAFLFIIPSTSLASDGKETSAQAEPRKEVSKTPEGAVIYYDQSQSIPGYFKSKLAKRTTLLEIFLQNRFLLTLSDNDIGPISVAPFSIAPGKPIEVNSPPDCWFHLYPKNEKSKPFKKTKRGRCYPGRHTRLDGVFDKKNLQDFRVALIMTDGVQSIEPLKKSDKTNLKCIEGSDIGCVKRAIKPLLEEGYGIWLIGLKSHFFGRVYPETPNLEGKAAAFDFNEPRPIYLFILSKEIELGRHVTEVLSKTLKKLRSRFKKPGDKELKVESLELAPLVNGKFKPLLVEDLLGDIRGEAAIVFDRQKETSEKGIFEQDGKCIGNKPVKYPLRIIVDPGHSNMDDGVPQAVSWRPRLVMNELQRNWVRLSEKESNKDNAWDWIVEIDCGRLPSRIQDSKVWLGIRSEPLKKKDRMPKNQWWFDWSTDDDSLKENANKTLNLDKLTSFIISDATSRPRRNSTIIFQIFK